MIPEHSVTMHNPNIMLVRTLSTTETEEKKSVATSKKMVDGSSEGRPAHRRKHGSQGKKNDVRKFRSSSSSTQSFTIGTSLFIIHEDATHKKYGTTGQGNAEKGRSSIPKSQQQGHQEIEHTDYWYSTRTMKKSETIDSRLDQLQLRDNSYEGNKRYKEEEATAATMPCTSSSSSSSCYSSSSSCCSSNGSVGSTDSFILDDEEDDESEDAYHFF